MQRAIGSLDTGAWDGRSRWRAEPLLDRVRPESARVADGLDELGRKLVRVADTFEQEDNTAAFRAPHVPCRPTFVAYENLRAIRYAARRKGWGEAEREDFFWNNAQRILVSPPTGS